MFFRNLSPKGLPTFEAGSSSSKWASFSRQPRVISLAVGVFTTIFIWLVLPHFHEKISEHTGVFTNSYWEKHSHDKLIANGTLGFEKIFTIGLSDRTDRRDSMEVAADVSNLHLTWMDGVLTSDMNQKTIPPTYKLPKVLPGVVGCWRSHMNVLRRIVAEKVQSALILEDDADWDVRIVEQMQQFAVATKDLLQTGSQEKNKKSPGRTNSPYGEGWDILWVGHCGGFHGNTSSVPHYIIKDDDTVPPAIAMDDMLFGVSPYRKWNEVQPDPPCTAHEGRDPPGKVCDSPRLAMRDRIVQERAKPVCTAGYAVSLQGARKLLARTGGLSLTDVFAPVDQGFGDVCAGATDVPGEVTRCFTPTPPYFRGYKAKGNAVGDSDIRVTGAHGEARKVGWSKGIMRSVRLNANYLLAGVDYEPEDQYVRDGVTKEPRLRNYNEYRAFKEDVVVKNWIW